MRRRVAFHSALHPPEDAPPMYRVNIGDLGIALQHDLMEPLPAEYERVDCLWLDPPWPDGFDTFNERAGARDDRTYAAFMARVGELIGWWPVVLVAGARALSYLPEPDTRKDVTLWGRGRAKCATWGHPQPDADHSTEIIRELVRRHRCIGDPVCGYGEVGREAMKAGTGFVLSDYDPRCIGHIAMEAKSW